MKDGNLDYCSKCGREVGKPGLCQSCARDKELEIKNTNDLVYKIAERAKKLANEPLPTLRYRASEEQEISFQTANRRLIHMNRGQLIEEILTEEFCEEFPGEIVRS